MLLTEFECPTYVYVVLEHAYIVLEYAYAILEYVYAYLCPLSTVPNWSNVLAYFVYKSTVLQFTFRNEHFLDDIKSSRVEVYLLLYSCRKH